MLTFLIPSVISQEKEPTEIHAEILQSLFFFFKLLFFFLFLSFFFFSAVVNTDRCGKHCRSPLRHESAKRTL
jgi:hypothetical protein